MEIRKKLLYYADFTLLSNDSKTDVDEDSDGNSQVLRFGSADYTVSKETIDLRIN